MNIEVTRLLRGKKKPRKKINANYVCTLEAEEESVRMKMIIVQCLNAKK